MQKIIAWFGGLLLGLAWCSMAYAGTLTTNEFFYKPSLGARGVQEKGAFDSGLDRVDARLGKELWVGDPKMGNTLQEAITAIGSDKVILRLPAGTYSITENLTVPGNVTLKVEQGALLAIGNGKTLTINGSIEAGLYQTFSCTGTGKVAFGAGYYKTVRPEWWGAVQGVDITAPFLKMMEAGHYLNVVCSPGTYYLKTGYTGTGTRDHINITGNNTIFKLPDGSNNEVCLGFTGCTNIRVSGIEIDGNRANCSASPNKGIVADDCTNVIIENCYVHDLLLAGDTGQDAPGIRMAGTANGKITNNTVINTDCGIYLKRSNDVIISNNYTKGGPSESISIFGDSTLTPNKTITITGNICYKSIHVSFCEDIAVNGNLFLATPVAMITQDGTGYNWWARRITVTGNTFAGTYILGDAYAAASYVTDITISGNNFNTPTGCLDIRGGDGIQITGNQLAQNTSGSNALVSSYAYPAVKNLTLLNNNSLVLNGVTIPYGFSLGASPMTVKGNTMRTNGGTITYESVRITTPLANLADVVITENDLCKWINCVAGKPGVVARNITALPYPTQITSAAAVNLVSAASYPWGCAFGDELFMEVQGTTNITSITPLTSGSRLTLLFDGILTVTDGNNLKLAGNFVTAAGSTLTLLSDGTNWRELSRSAN
jgi:parallel beta-helix repeat protein